METTFYTPNGWEGNRYKPGMRAKDVAKEVREYIRKDAELSACKWSVRCEDGTFISSLYIALMSAPFDPFSEEFKEKHPFDYERRYSQHGTCQDFVSPECLRVMEKLKAFVMQYIHDDSDGMIDYYDRNIYDHYEIGQSDKPFQQSEAIHKKQTARLNQESTGIQIVEYSDRAIAVIGDTYPVRDKLKNLGGRFNSRLSCGAGWVFSRNRREELKAAFNS